MKAMPEMKVTVLLLGGSSGTGKSTMGAQLGRSLGAPWLQVDDLRLALQRSHVTLPARTKALYFFLQEGIWRRTPEALRDGLIAIGEVMAPAVEVVVENHVAQGDACIIEGDGILPSLLDRPAIRRATLSGQVQSVFLFERDESVLFSNMLERDREFHALPSEEQRSVVRATWLFGEWLAAEALRRKLHVIDSRPWETLASRIREAIG